MDGLIWDRRYKLSGPFWCGMAAPRRVKIIMRDQSRAEYCDCEKVEIKPTKKQEAEPESKRKTRPWKKRGGEHQSKAEAKK